jgi:hypothetical protein
MANEEIINPAETLNNESSEPVTLSTLIETMDKQGDVDPLKKAIVLSVTSRLTSRNASTIEDLNAFLELHGVESFIEKFLQEADSPENRTDPKPAQIGFVRRKSSTTMTAVVVPTPAPPESIEPGPVSMTPTSGDLLEGMKQMRAAVEGALYKGKEQGSSQTYSIIDTERTDSKNGQSGK